ncbi:MAG: hypothetical protein WDN29_07875 [Methylovirgula sp.]
MTLQSISLPGAPGLSETTVSGTEIDVYATVGQTVTADAAHGLLAPLPTAVEVIFPARIRQRALPESSRRAMAMPPEQRARQAPTVFHTPSQVLKAL